MPTITTPRREPNVARAAAALLTGTAVLLAAAPTRALAQDECLGARAAPSVQTLDRAAGAVVCLVNADRARHRLRALRGDGDLRQAAGRHSRNMVRRGFFSHESPDGADLGVRLRRSGYVRGKPTRRVGEILAWGRGTPSTPTRIVAAWIESPPHHRILLGRRFRDVGVGVAVGTPQATTGGRGGATYTLDTGGKGGSSAAARGTATFPAAPLPFAGAPARPSDASAVAHPPTAGPFHGPFDPSFKSPPRLSRILGDMSKELT